MSHKGKLKTVIGLSVMLCTLTLIGLAAASMTNGRNDQITFIAIDRSGGAPELLNGDGARAEVYIQWYQTTTTHNSRGDVLETGTDGIVHRNGVWDWNAYQVR